MKVAIICTAYNGRVIPEATPIIKTLEKTWHFDGSHFVVDDIGHFINDISWLSDEVRIGVHSISALVSVEFVKVL